MTAAAVWGRRVALGAAVGAVAGTVGSAAVVSAEAAWAARREYADPAGAPIVDGHIGEPGGRPLRLAVLGDSTGAGLGVSEVAATVGGQLARRLARRGWRVRLTGVAVSGSRCRDLGPQVSRALLGRPDVALICIGANDALRGSRVTAVQRDLGAVVERLQSAGVQTVVATCPDLGAARSFLQPLRALAGRRGRRVAAAQARGTAAAGGVGIELGRLTGPIFRADPGTLSPDRFHPSADGYRLWAEVLLPAVEAAARRRHPQAS